MLVKSSVNQNLIFTAFVVENLGIGSIRNSTSPMVTARFHHTQHARPALPTVSLQVQAARGLDLRSKDPEAACRLVQIELEVC